MSQPSAKKVKKQFKNVISKFNNQQYHRIIKTLQTIKWMKQLPIGLIEFIAQYAIGYIIECNVVSCRGEIFFLTNDYRDIDDDDISKANTNLFDIAILKCDECKTKFNAFVCSHSTCDKTWLCLEESNYIKQNKTINNKAIYLFKCPQGVCTGTGNTDCRKSYCSIHYSTEGVNCLICQDYYCSKCAEKFGQNCLTCNSKWCCCDCIKKDNKFCNCD